MRSVFNEFSSPIKRTKTTTKTSQQELANLLGISTRAWRFYESGDREPNIAGLIALADYFDVFLDYLVGRTDDDLNKNEPEERMVISRSFRFIFYSILE
ncbi:transcriptional regulator with XRE-family HTH domain [Sporomusaceae bacterium BoRhaA]|uniref:helix-turn-helix domain-containing protein n=1 Tax=Pelorhabdus rhamnosifermentans TaxID=2772457 RepID=UPI001FEBE0B4|nr:helix-turn-helix transcriptional regulator [Pelorhabdus rhamnosifermentans]MBU2702727.1 transcriptional regulator with XRE-family HTH domain [Pelorhabdus rhamnosifermentans]